MTDMGNFALNPKIFASAQEFTQGKFDIKMIDVDKLVPHSENFYAMTEIELLGEDIERQGLRTPLLVVAIENEKYRIISGHRRHKAVIFLREAGRYASRLLPCVIGKAKTDDEEMQDLIMLNATGREISDSERLKQYEYLRDILERRKENGEKITYIRQKIADMLKISTGQVSKLENIDNNAIDEVKQAIQSGDLSLSTAYEIAKLDKDEQHELLDAKNASEITSKEVKAKQKENLPFVAKKPIEDSNEESDNDTENTDEKVLPFVAKKPIEDSNEESDNDIEDTDEKVLPFVAKNPIEDTDTDGDTKTEKCETLSAYWGYVIQTCEMFDYSEEQTAEFLDTFKTLFKEQSFEEARKYYRESRFNVHGKIIGHFKHL
ncbi:hypothetical protein FACS1894188_01760 [Clostridia bacterium]|nr:hypothetical protein FACS1894188_01760 [Clostridia bacterium]